MTVPFEPTNYPRFSGETLDEVRAQVAHFFPAPIKRCPFVDDALTQVIESLTISHSWSEMTDLCKIAASDQMARIFLEATRMIAVKCRTFPELSKKRDEIVSDVMYAIYEGNTTFDPDKGSFFGWLKGITNNVSLHVNRKRKIERHSVSLEADSPIIRTEPVAKLARTEAEIRQACLEHLHDPVDQTIFQAKFIDNMGSRQLADKLGLSVNTIDKRVQRIREKLADLQPSLGERSLG